MFDFLPSLVRFGTQVIQCLGHFVVGYKMTWVLNDLFSSKLDRQSFGNDMIFSYILLEFENVEK